MKIRIGFVSNSSSSSFVVFVPNDLPLTDEYLYDKARDISDRKNLKPLIKLVREDLEALRNGEEVWQSDYDRDAEKNMRGERVYIAEEICRDFGLILATVNHASGHASVYGITKKSMRSALDED